MILPGASNPSHKRQWSSRRILRLEVRLAGLRVAVAPVAGKSTESRRTTYEMSVGREGGGYTIAVPTI